MTFFSSAKLPFQKIEIDVASVSSSSPEVLQRMARISANYDQLDVILSSVEATIQNDERLSAINDSILEVEIEVNGQKKKWRPRPKLRPKAGANSANKKSANPKKPR
jgi:hypothetical protein